MSIYRIITLLSTVNLLVWHKNQRKLWFWIVIEGHKMCQRTYQHFLVKRRPLDYGRMTRRYNRLLVFVAKRNWCSSLPIMLYMLLLVSSLEVHFHQIFDSITKLFFTNINSYMIIYKEITQIIEWYEISIIFICICTLFVKCLWMFRLYFVIFQLRFPIMKFFSCS